MTLSPSELAFLAKAIVWGAVIGAVYTFGKIVGRRSCDS